MSKEDERFLDGAIQCTNIRLDYYKNYGDKKCYVCGKKVEYAMVMRGDEVLVALQQSGYGGVDRPVCRRCWKMSLWLNDNLILYFIRIIRKFGRNKC